MARKNAPITDEVKKRLDEIFLENEDAPNAEKDQVDVQASPLAELQSIILSIEWEISDDVMHRFLEEVAKLKDSYNGDRIMGPFFKMLDSLGRYINRYKAKANPGAIKVLNSVYAALEKILLSDGLKEIEKENILLKEVQGFKGLKKEIHGGKKVAEAGGRVGKTASELVAGKDVSIDWDEGQEIPESFLAALHELKALIRSEFKALREDMRTWLDEESGSKRRSDRKTRRK